MRAFRFSLARVRQLRAAQLELEEGKLQQLADHREALVLETVRLKLVQERAEAAVRQAAAVAADELWALAAYRDRLKSELQALATRQQDCERQLAAQRQRVLEAQRQCRLLERLEERRRAEWQMAADRELQNLANESFLARWRGAD